MTSQPVRDPLHDHLLTPQNAALVLIDYQNAQINSIPVDPDTYIPNVVALAKAGMLYHAVVDAVAGTSRVAHDAALQRIHQAGAHLVSWIAVMTELQRDWSRTETSQGMLKIALERGGPFGTEVALKFDRLTVAA